MTIGPSTEGDVRKAMQRFDLEMRDTAEWRQWEENNNHKFAFVSNGRHYPMKEVISMATGTPKSDFSGGEEAIRFAKKLSFDVEALRLPSEAEIGIALHESLLANYPEPVEPKEAYDKLAAYFHLSKSLRTLQLATDGQNQWENRVQWARNNLVQTGILDNRERGVWQLKSRGTPKFWIEKCLVKGRPDRESGPDALGKALWSPTRDARGADVYRNMRLIQPGDVVFHLIDNDRMAGVSVVSGRAKPDFYGVKGTDWADRLCYRIELKDYEELSPPIQRSEFLDVPKRQEELRDILNHHENLFYNSKFELNQGAYITEAPQELVDMFSDIYRKSAGREFPKIADLQSKRSTLFNERRLRASILLFKWIYGEEGFASNRYLTEERNYKVSLLEEWRSLVTIESLQLAISGTSPESVATNIGALLTKSNLLPWRYNEVLRSFPNSDTARSFLSALKTLLFDRGSDKADIDGFNNALMPRYRSELNETAIKPTSHCIPSLVLWLTYPDEHFFVRPELYNRATRVLMGSSPKGQGEVMTSDYYQSARQFATSMRDALAELSPRDMIDVQGFCWGVFSRNKIWFGGKSYGGTRDMLPEFMARQVYAVGFGKRDEIVALLKGVPSLDKATRLARRNELVSKCEKTNERNALVNFFDLLSAPGSILLAKSTWYDKGLEQSLLKISAVCRTGDHVAFDEEIGHQVSVEWLSTPDHVVEASDYYPVLAPTLTSHPLEDALDIIGLNAPRAKPSVPTETEEAKEAEDLTERVAPPALPVQPQYTIEDFTAETGFSPDIIADWHQRLKRKKQVVFQGPPGTGKTYVSECLARLMVSQSLGTWDVVQFHPSYSYEDFMQGIRPQVISGGLTYQIEPGRFLEFCRKAEKRQDGAPCVLIIDELNRANLSRVFGELMYLLEYRDKKIPLSIGGEEFQVPKNVFIIGTMNTADRSIALVDHALRRRFSFIHLDPAYGVLEQRLKRDDLPADSLVSVLRSINREIDDRNYLIGISFFMTDGKGLRAALEAIWKGEIEPYLEEYFYDQLNKVDSFRWEALIATGLKDWL
jgi:MoxR-like ATPase